MSRIRFLPVLFALLFPGAVLSAGEVHPGKPPAPSDQGAKPSPPVSEDVFKELDANKQDKLDYNVETLPDAVKSLIEKEIAISQFVNGYQKASDEKKKFNLILILDKKLRADQYKGDDRAKAVEFLRQALKNGNPWVRTEAVYALGNIDAAEAKADIVSCLDDNSLTATYRAYFAYKQIFNELPEINR